jgi:hypothetical protein
MAKALVDPGSMLNTSEGLISTGTLAALTTALTTSTDWRVQMAAALGMAVIAAAYVLSRGKVKSAEAGIIEE